MRTHLDQEPEKIPNYLYLRNPLSTAVYMHKVKSYAVCTLIVMTIVPGGAPSVTDVPFSNEINIGMLSFWSPTVI